MLSFRNLRIILNHFIILLINDDASAKTSLLYLFFAFLSPRRLPSFCELSWNVESAYSMLRNDFHLWHFAMEIECLNRLNRLRRSEGDTWAWIGWHHYEKVFPSKHKASENKAGWEKRINLIKLTAEFPFRTHLKSLCPQGLFADCVTGVCLRGKSWRFLDWICWLSCWCWRHLW